MSDFSIRTSRYRRLFTAPPGLSQCPTSFFGIQRQGIPRKLLVAFHVMQGTGPSSGLSVLLFTRFVSLDTFMVGFIFECFPSLAIWPTYCIRLSTFLRSLRPFRFLSFDRLRKAHNDYFVGLSGLEPETSPLSEARSNQLS